MKSALLLLWVLLLSTTLHAQSIGMGYYDLDALYDTIPSRFYDDSDYTPSGKYSWNSARYNTKVNHMVAVIDSMRLPIIGLYGVENEAVVRDIVLRSQQDYSYIHRTRNSFDGLDFSLLYFGDKLFIEDVEPLRNMLVIDATLDDQTPILIILSRSGDDTAEYLSHNPEQERLVVVMGKLYQREIDRLGYTNTLKEREQQGEGNYCAMRGWMMHDRIATNRKDKLLKNGVFITPWLLDPSTRRPVPTLDKGAYKGGFGKYLPIFTYIY